MRLFELGLGQLAQKVTLVFVGVNARQQTVGHLSIHLERFLPAVVAGSYTFRPQFKGRLEEQVKLDFAVAQHIWVWGPTRSVLLEHVVHNALLVLGREVEDLEWDAEVRSNEHGVVRVIDPWAFVVDDDGFVVPIAHEDANDFVACLLQ